MFSVCSRVTKLPLAPNDGGGWARSLGDAVCDPAGELDPQKRTATPGAGRPRQRSMSTVKYGLADGRFGLGPPAVRRKETPLRTLISAPENHERKTGGVLKGLLVISRVSSISRCAKTGTDPVTSATANV